MATSVWNFVKRHKKKFIFMGTVVGGGYLLLRYSLRKIYEIQEREAAEFLMCTRKLTHFEKNERTCSDTVTGMLPTLEANISKFLDTDSLTAELQTNPARKIEIWNTLKVLGVTRAIVTVYSVCHLVICLRIQLNILGGYMYQDSLAGLSDQHTGGTQLLATPEVQQKYLENVHYIVEKGLSSLCTAVQQAASNVLANVSLKDKYSLDDVGSILKQIRVQLEGGDVYSSTLAYAMPASVQYQQGCLSQREWKILGHMYKETLDVLESEDLHKILSSCLDVGFSSIMDHLAEYYTTEDSSATGDGAAPRVSFKISCTSVPIAKLIPVMTNIVSPLCVDRPTGLAQAIFANHEVRTFAANIYEAFSQSDDSIP